MADAATVAMDLFELGDFPLQCGGVLPAARVAYKTYGELNSARNNAILYPTSFAAQHPDIEWLIHRDRILDPTQYFVIIANMFGNGFSTSPSNWLCESSDQKMPVTTHVDNANAQRRLLDEVFGIERLALAYGWSMGAQQALHFGALFPERVARIAALCGSAKTSVYNRVFLEGIRATLTTDPTWNGERFLEKPTRGLRAMGRVYAGFALSQQFFRDEVYTQLGYDSLEDFLVRDWEASFLRRDAANLLAMIETWQRSDISANEFYHGDLTRALSSIQARTLIMPCNSDFYFTAAESEAEARQIPQAKFLPITSAWGHRAGNPAKSPVDEKFIRDAVAELLACDAQVPADAN